MFVAIHNLSLKVKILAIISFCIVTISGVSFISIHFISQAYQKVLYRSISGSLSYSAAEIEGRLTEIDQIADQILANRAIQEELASMQHSSGSKVKLSQTKLYNSMCDYIYNTAANDFSFLSIYQDKRSITTSVAASSKVPSPVIANLIAKGEEAQGATLWITDYCNTYGLFLVKEIRQIENLSLKPLGVLVIQVDLAHILTSTTAFSSDYEDAAYFLYFSKDLIYRGESLSNSDADSLTRTMKNSYQVVRLSHKDYFAVKGSIPKYNWDYLCAVSYSSIARTIVVTIQICLLVMFLCIVFVILTASGLLASLIHNFDRLILKMKQFGEGTYTPDSEDARECLRTDEIGLLYANFDAMANRVTALIEENYVNELLKQEAQIKAMESQMDPHFLYNTLDSIHWRALALGATDISQITMALGGLLRMTLDRRTTSFTIREEISVLENYILIQQMRHQKRLQFKLNIPESLYSCEIPKLTLQPLVENAIRYGLEENPDTCTIAINAIEVAETIQIQIQNNGSSFEEDLIAKLQTQEILPHGFGIGILNIHRRLQLTYGPDYGLTLWNQENDATGEEYAIACVTIPKYFAVEGDINHVKTTDY